jgi:HEAT repeat protein
VSSAAWQTLDLSHCKVARQADRERLLRNLQSYMRGNQSVRTHLGQLMHGDHPAQHDSQHAYGVFASVAIQPFEVIGEYQGVRVTSALNFDFAEGAPWDRQAYIFSIGSAKSKSVSVDAGEYRSEMAFVNDFRDLKSKTNDRTANVEARTVSVNGTLHILVWATRKIAPYEELLLDYGKGYWDCFANHHRGSAGVPKSTPAIQNGECWSPQQRYMCWQDAFLNLPAPLVDTDDQSRETQLSRWESARAIIRDISNAQLTQKCREHGLRHGTCFDMRRRLLILEFDARFLGHGDFVADHHYGPRVTDDVPVDVCSVVEHIVQSIENQQFSLYSRLEKSAAPSPIGYCSHLNDNGSFEATVFSESGREVESDVTVDGYVVGDVVQPLPESSCAVAHVAPPGFRALDCPEALTSPEAENAEEITWDVAHGRHKSTWKVLIDQGEHGFEVIICPQCRALSGAKKAELVAALKVSDVLNPKWAAMIQTHVTSEGSIGFANGAVIMRIRSNETTRIVCAALYTMTSKACNVHVIGTAAEWRRLGICRVMLAELKINLAAERAVWLALEVDVRLIESGNCIWTTAFGFTESHSRFARTREHLGGIELAFIGTKWLQCGVGSVVEAKAEAETAWGLLYTCGYEQKRSQQSPDIAQPEDPEDPDIEPPVMPKGCAIGTVVYSKITHSNADGSIEPGTRGVVKGPAIVSDNGRVTVDFDSLSNIVLNVLLTQISKTPVEGAAVGTSCEQTVIEQSSEEMESEDEEASYGDISWVAVFEQCEAPAIPSNHGGIAVTDMALESQPGKPAPAVESEEGDPFADEAGTPKQTVEAHEAHESNEATCAVLVASQASDSNQEPAPNWFSCKDCGMSCPRGQCENLGGLEVEAIVAFEAEGAEVRTVQSFSPATESNSHLDCSPGEHDINAWSRPGQELFWRVRREFWSCFGTARLRAACLQRTLAICGGKFDLKRRLLVSEYSSGLLSTVDKADHGTVSTKELVLTVDATAHYSLYGRCEMQFTEGGITDWFAGWVTKVHEDLSLDVTFLDGQTLEGIERTHADLRPMNKATRSTLAGAVTMKNVDNLTHGKATIRRTALQALAKLGVGAAPFLPEIIARLADNTILVRKAAVVALGRLHSHMESYWHVILTLLADSDVAVRVSASEALGKMGPSLGSNTVALVDGLADSNDGVRQAAVDALQGIGCHALPHVPAILRCLAHANCNCRNAAILALESIDVVVNRTNLPLLEELINSSAAETRHAAFQVLGMLTHSEICHATGQQLLILTGRLYRSIASKLDFPDDRPAAVRALQNMGQATAKYGQPVISRLKHSDCDVRLAAAEVLSTPVVFKCIAPSSQIVLHTVNLEHPDKTTRDMSTTYLLNLPLISRGTVCFEHLVSRLPTMFALIEHANPEIQTGVTPVLLRMGRHGHIGERFMVDLVTKLEHERYSVANIAMKTLARLESSHCSKYAAPKLLELLSPIDLDDDLWSAQPYFELLCKPGFARHIPKRLWSAQPYFELLCKPGFARHIPVDELILVYTGFVRAGSKIKCKSKILDFILRNFSIFVRGQRARLQTFCRTIKTSDRIVSQIPMFVELLDHASVSVSEAAALVLVHLTDHIGVYMGSIIAKMEQTRTHNDAKALLVNFVGILRAFSNSNVSTECVPQLIPMLEHSDRQVRAAVADILSAPKCWEVVPVAARVLHHVVELGFQNVKYNSAAIDGLCKIGAAQIVDSPHLAPELLAVRLPVALAAANQTSIQLVLSGLELVRELTKLEFYWDGLHVRGAAQYCTPVYANCAPLLEHGSFEVRSQAQLTMEELGKYARGAHFNAYYVSVIALRLTNKNELIAGVAMRWLLAYEVAHTHLFPVAIKRDMICIKFKASMLKLEHTYSLDEVCSILIHLHISHQHR